MKASTTPSTGPRRWLNRTAWLLAVFGGWLAAPAAHAQIELNLQVGRRSYILYESIVATITITNNAGRDLTFEDSGTKQWFNMEVSTLDGQLLSPYDPNYHLHPMHIAAGQTLQRSIDLTPLFPIRQMGTNRLRANVYLADLDRFYYSNYASFDLTDGKVIWQKTVGVPGEEGLRQVSLLTHELPDRLLLYARIRDEAGSTIYTTQSLGRLLLSGREPDAILDSHNNLHILQEARPGAFVYTCIGLDGARIDQKAYIKSGHNQPTLVKMADGGIGVRGGQVQVATAKAVPGSAPQPKLSDRPAGMPAPVKGD